MHQARRSKSGGPARVGCRAFTAVTRVRIPLGSPTLISLGNGLDRASARRESFKDRFRRSDGVRYGVLLYQQLEAGDIKDKILLW